MKPLDKSDKSIFFARGSKYISKIISTQISNLFTEVLHKQIPNIQKPLYHNSYYI